MTNMKQRIDNYTNEKGKEEFTRTCNCQDKTSCPLNGKCLQEGVVYKAIVTQQELKKTRHIHRDDGKSFQNEMQPP